MARPPRGRSGVGSWQWARTAETQRALLDAARAVFTGQGFADASIADVVERAGSSVGSLYHHFGGKSELFIALWQEHQLAHEEAASRAVADARKQGTADPGQLFEAGARAFLQGSWQRRDLALLFLSGDGPPGFELMQRQRGHEWVGQNDALLLRGEERTVHRAMAGLPAGPGGGRERGGGPGQEGRGDRLVRAVLGRRRTRARRWPGPGRPG